MECHCPLFANAPRIEDDCAEDTVDTSTAADVDKEVVASREVVAAEDKDEFVGRGQDSLSCRR